LCHAQLSLAVRQRETDGQILSATPRDQPHERRHDLLILHIPKPRQPSAVIQFFRVSQTNQALVAQMAVAKTALEEAKRNSEHCMPRA